jgi:Predicted permeases
MLILQQMAMLFILMLVGYICYKTKLITEDAGKTLSAIVVHIANPALILYASMGSDIKIQGSELALTLGIATAMIGALILFSYLVPVVLRVDKDSRGIYRVMTAFSNIGFMGFPLISAVYGPGALIYASIFTLPYNILIYTYGINSMKKPGAEKEKFRLGKIFNAGVIASILTIAIYLLKIPVPKLVSTPMQHLSNLTTPLSMIVIGASLASIDLKKLFFDVRMLVFSVIKLIIIPIAGYLIIRQFVSGEILRGVCLVMLMMPVGSMTAMLASQYDGDFDTATRGIALTTLLSVLTIPLVSAILR